MPVSPSLPPFRISTEQQKMMKPAKRVLAIHDLCSFGRCSLTAAIPVLSAQGVQACPFPTALFSNNFTYGSFVFSDFTEKMRGFMDEWEKLQLPFDAVYSGFLASLEQMEVVKEAARRFASREDALVVVDPAMGDDGKLYPIYTPEMVAGMRSLVRQADLITPNYTEACLLLERPYETRMPEDAELEVMCRELAAFGAKQVVITSVPGRPDEIRVASFDVQKESFVVHSTERIPFATCGTGDIFTSVVTGALLQGEALDAAVLKAMRFVSHAIEHTMATGADVRAGVQLEPCLRELMR